MPPFLTPITDFNQIPPLHFPCGVTIGTFDGVHLGHQSLLKDLRDTLPQEGISVVVTFSNHPSHLFSPQSPIPLIYPFTQKITLLRQAGADLIIALPFTAAFAQTPFEQFLNLLKTHLNFSLLVLGEHSTFGKDRQGSATHVQTLAKTLHFDTHYLPKLLFDGHPISSGQIRAAIQNGDFQKASSCLGRPYSLTGTFQQGDGSYFLPLQGICLPPSGTYPIHARLSPNSQPFLGQASIDGKNATLHLILEKPLPYTSAPFEAEVLFLE